MKRTILSLAFLLFVFSGLTRATTLTWVSPADGDWNDAANWLPAQVPANGDSVIITNAGTYAVTNNGSAILSGLTLGGTNGTQTLSIASLTLSGTGLVNSNGVLNWAGGSLDGALTVAPGGTLTISNSVNFSYVNAQFGYTNTAFLTNHGTVLWAGSATSYANPSGYGGGTIIYNTGLWQAVGDHTLSFTYAGGTQLFINPGTMQKIGGTGLSTINWNLINNGGTLLTPVGALAFANWTGDGLVNGNAIVTGTLSGIIASNAVLNWIGGSLDGALTVAPGGTLTISNGVNFSYVNAQFGYTNTAFLTNHGTVLWAGSATSYANPSGYGGGTIIYNTGLWQAVGDHTLSFTYAGGTQLFINPGTFQKTNSSGSTSVQWPFYNSGTVTVRTGTLALSSIAAQTAGLTSLNGGDLSVTQPFQLLGGVLAGNNSILGSVTNNGGTVSPGLSPGKLTITGSYTQTTNGTLQIELAGTLPGTTFDQLVVNGAARLAGTLTVSLTNGFVPVTNSTFTILTAGSRSGGFGNFTYPTAVVGMLPIYNPASVVILVTNAPPPFGPLVDHGVFLTHFIGTPGTNYTIEWTPVLPAANWQKLTNIIAPLDDYGLGVGAIELRDPVTPSNRFYRTVTPAY